MEFFKVKNLTDAEAEVQVYGEIITNRPKNWWTGQPSTNMYFVSSEFNKLIEKLKNKSKITVKINSPGGDMFVGVGVYNQLKQLKADITVIIEGLAASAAGIIACAGDTVKIGTGAVFMAHQAKCLVSSDYMSQTECEKQLNMITTCNKAVNEIISKRTGKTIDEVAPLIESELWLSGEAAIEFGIANELLETEDGNPVPSVDPVNNSIYSGGQVFAIKNYIENADKHLSAYQNKTVGQPTEKSKEEEPMSKETAITLEALKNDYPDIVKSIADEAAKSAIKTERQRQKAIDEIAPVIADKETLSDAKYGDSGISAESLLYNAAKANAGKGAGFFAAMVADNSASNAGAVKTAPTGIEENNETKVANEISAAVKLFNESKEV